MSVFIGLQATELRAEETLNFHSNQKKSDYVIYKSVKGDWPIAILRRLDLQPIFGNKGSLFHFFKLNPELNKKFKSNKNYKMPAGTLLVLPVSKIDFKSESRKFVIKNGALKFLGSHSARQSADYTQVLNLKAMKVKKQPSKMVYTTFSRRPASATQRKSEPVKKTGNKKTRQHKAKDKYSNQPFAKAKKKQWSDFNYSLGNSRVKVPVSVDSPLYKSLQAGGFLPLNKAADGPIFVEVALNKNPVQSAEPLSLSVRPDKISVIKKDQRQTAAVNTSQLELKNKSPFHLDVKALTVSRLYSIVDSNGQSGEIGIDPGVGVDLGMVYQYSWLNLDTRLQIQTENFKPDSNIAIEQESNSRFDFRLRQKMDLGWLDIYFGGGLGTSASFVTVNSTTLQAKHLNRPYAHLGVAKSFSWLSELKSRTEISYEALFGAEEGLYKLENGYRASVFLFNNWRLSSSLYLSGDVGIISADDQPATYEQSYLEFQFLIGLGLQF